MNQVLSSPANHELGHAQQPPISNESSIYVRSGSANPEGIDKLHKEVVQMPMICIPAT